ncbi:MAG TPA: DUF1501 domain-containing protein [Gemmataceae bacterium]|nr:DUF1501 domain-containing protein [Gemmataceae bacterium]
MEPLNRRHFLRLGGLAGATWLTPLGHMLARAAETAPDKRETAQSIIVIWLQGGPSQLETFDPHPGKAIAGGTGAINTTVKGIQLAPGLERTAEEMQSISLIRSLVSKEGDHERGSYNLATGFRPDPTVIHPSIGAICCHELPVGNTEIPRHVSILPPTWPFRGGFLGDQYNAFRIDDPAGPIPDCKSFLPAGSDDQRLKNLDVVESAFAKGREKRVASTLHRETVAGARKMMNSEQLKAFDVSKESASVRKAYGETPFGRGCLAARRLIEVGVRCVEVTLSGWDTHVNNHKQVSGQLAIFDPAYSALIRDLRERKLLDKTLVLVAGEFGRTPAINAAGGRDHWPTGFSVALAGGGIRGGQVIGKTDPEGKPEPEEPVSVGDLFATMLTAVGINPGKLNQTPIGRTVAFSDKGKPIEKLLGRA